MPTSFAATQEHADTNTSGMSSFASVYRNLATRKPTLDARLYSYAPFGEEGKTWLAIIGASVALWLVPALLLTRVPAHARPESRQVPREC
ncbi:MAG: hypothetical protein ACI9KS_002031 [Sulfitobacter sp.]|jgi:hypothetical protein